jgi:hypothetical protein
MRAQASERADCSAPRSRAPPDRAPSPASRAQGDDILWALGTLGFDHYVDGMRVYLALFRETARAKEKSGAKVVDDDDDE